MSEAGWFGLRRRTPLREEKWVMGSAGKQTNQPQFKENEAKQTLLELIGMMIEWNERRKTINGECLVWLNGAPSGSAVSEINQFLFCWPAVRHQKQELND